MKMGMKIENELIGGHKGMWPSIEHKTYCTKRERSQFLIKVFPFNPSTSKFKI